MKELKVGMWVYLRDDLEANVRYGEIYWVEDMHKGIWVQVNELFDDDSFHINSNGPYYYTPEMIDWEKTNLGHENMADQFGMKQESEASKPKIKFKLYNEGRMVIFRVLEQSKDITNSTYEDKTYSYQASNGFMIESSLCPMICQGSVYIRGSHEECDNDVDVLLFNSEQEAKEYIDMVLFAFKEWSDKGYPFGDNKLSDDELDDNTYIF